MFRSHKYEGRKVRINDLQADGSTTITGVSVRQGINRELIEEIAGADTLGPDGSVSARLQAYTANARVKITTRGSRTTLTYGEVFFATLELKQ